jgi:hypothetical protein
MHFCGQKCLVSVFAQVIHCFVAADFAMSSGRGGRRSNTSNSYQIFTKISMKQ